MIDVAFTPAFTPEEEMELAKQQVADLTDAWPWLGEKINGERLTWPDIFQLVADNL